MYQFLRIAALVSLLHLCCVWAYDPEFLPTAQEDLNFCVQQLNVTPEEHKLYLNPLRNLTIFDDNKKVKCLSRCFLERSQIMKDGQFLHAETRKRFDHREAVLRAIYYGIFDRCQNVTKEVADHCEAAHRLAHCFDEADRVLTADN